VQLRESFGLDQPLIVQYLLYIKNTLTLDFGLSTASFPTPVAQLIGQAMPWTIGLMLISLIITFIIGNLLGALMVWENTPKLWKVAIPRPWSSPRSRRCCRASC
jgi:peptide/nickel transport system permease protein